MAATVRCKFMCNSVTKSVHWNDKSRNLYSAKFTVVYGDSEENKKFFEASPSGSFEIGTYKEDHFEPGKQYYLDITPAPVPVPAA